MRAVFLARWMNGAASLDWLLDHPDWYLWVDICAQAHDEAQEARAQQQQQAAS